MTDLPNGWHFSRLDEVATIVRGVTYSSKDVLGSQTTEAIRLLRATNIQNGVLDQLDPVWIPRTLVKPQQVLDPGDVVIASSSGSIQVVGKSAMVKAPMDATFGAFCTTVRATNVLPAYLAFYLQDPSLRQKWSDLASGSNINNLKTTDIAATLIPVPPLEEQRRIVEVLDDHLSRLDKALADLHNASVKSSQLFLAALDGAQKEVGLDRHKPLGDCLQVLDGKKFVQRGWSPQCLTYPQSSPNNWAVLKTTAVQNMRYEFQHNKELPRTLDPKTHLEVHPGDFLMTTTGPRNRCGVVCYVANTPEKLIFSGKILRFRPDLRQLVPEWLELVLASHKYQKKLDSLKVGSSDSSVSIGNAQVLELVIPVPTLEEQVRIISRISQIKELSRRFEQEIAQETRKFHLLRNALLSSAFAGNLERE